VDGACQKIVFYWLEEWGIGASRYSGSLELFCGISWAAEGIDARRPKSGLATVFTNAVEGLSGWCGYRFLFMVRVV
jgi:hypothetical protein